MAVILESVPAIDERFHLLLRSAEWIFTLLFTVEYVLRLLCVRRPTRYARSFFGVVDLLAILPTYLSLLIPGSQELLVIRGLRLLRIFRIFKLGRYLGEAEALKQGLIASRAKITVFLTTVIVSVTIMGAAMHLVEGPESGFIDIPHGMYWAIVTMTTVGFGGYHAADGRGQVSCVADDGFRLQPDHRAHGDHQRRDRGGQGPACQHRDVPALYESRPR